MAEGAAPGEKVPSGADTLGFLSDVKNATQHQQTGVPHGVLAALYNASLTPDGATRLAQRLATDDGLHQRLSATLGSDAADRLRAMGQSEATGAERLAHTSPRSPANDSSSFSVVSSAAQAIGAGHAGSLTGFWYHTIQAVRSFPGVRMSDALQKKVAGMLTDPAQRQQAISYLHAQGARDHDLRVLITQIGKAPAVQVAWPPRSFAGASSETFRRAGGTGSCPLSRRRGGR